MAAPADITIKNLSGEWVMDSTLSNPTDPILALQGMGWLLRKTLGYATVTLYIHSYPDTETPTIHHVDIQQVVTGGIQGTKECRVTDWTERDHTDNIFGTLHGRSRLLEGKSEEGALRPTLEVQTVVGEAEADAKNGKFLRGEVLVDGSKSEGFSGEDGEGVFLQSFVRNDEAGWTAEQVWGFELVEGERRHTRRVVVTKDGKVEMARLVYSFNARRVEE
ncbi:uncharacterized protein N7511_001991 [Penicillium nucicola]|uniref:uncharacterized protein n=1 Tax=Penicillium nucicola TaxID=1850975 RepID=UPI002544F4B6|nr:uncharacterized protein N7511_001991 [Penicillium nucicola]KAJ5769940.1 hypothetical protein N7511_001991 [Penicillium nucicola]